MSRTLQARRVVLALIALVFLGIAIGAAIAPQSMAEPLGYRLDNTNALNEFRAIYLGLWLAHAFILGWAALRIEKLELGDVGAILLLGQFVGRLVSLVLDGAPDPQLLKIAAAEPVGALLLLWLRPSRPSR